MKITETSVRRPLAISMVFIGLLVFGVVSLSKLTVDLFPNITFPMMVVLTSYPGAGPQETERQITEPFEKVLGTLNNIEDITSTSSENTSMIMLRFTWGTNLDAASNDVRDRLGIVLPYIPDEVDQPLIFKFDISQQPIVMFSVRGDINPMELDRITENIADRIQRADGVAGSYAQSSTFTEIHVTFNPEKLVSTGITADQVVGVLQAQNLNYPLGSVESGDKSYSLRIIGEYKNLDDIRKTIVGNSNGVPVALGQLADIRLESSEATVYSRTNGVPSIWGMVQKRSDANTVSVCGNVMRIIGEIRKDLPSGVAIDIIFNQADFINRSVKSTADTLWMGALLAAIILFLFLGNLRATVFVGVAMPITIFFTLFLMFIFNMSLNIISLGGLTIAIGMVVDNAIVVFEAIYRHRQEKKEMPDIAAIVGTKEVGMAITASTLTTIAVFLPLLLVRGFASIFFTQLALTVTFALVSSLVVAITIVPMLMSKFLQIKETGLTKIVKIFYTKLENNYTVLIKWALTHRKTVAWTSLGLFVVSLALFPFIGAELSPNVDQNEIQIEAEMPLGTKLATTDSAVSRLEKIVKQEVPELENSFVTVGTGTGFTALFGGGGGSHTGTIWLGLVQREQRKRSVTDIQRDLRKKMNGIPGMVTRFTSDQAMMFGSEKPIEIKIIGYDLARSKKLSDDLIELLKGVKGVVDIESDFSEGRPEIQFIVDRYKAAQFGLTTYQIGSVLRSRIEGTIATQYRIEGDEYDVRVRFSKKYRDAPEKIRSMTVTTPLGEVPLRNFLKDTTTVGPAQIEHENTYRIVKVSANVEGRDPNSATREVQKKLKDFPRPSDFEIKLSGGFEEMQNTFRDIYLVIALSLFLVYIIMVGQFESLKEPFIIMFTIPLGIIGVLWALFFTGTTFNMQSLLGVLILGGVVVNNAIVYIDYTNQLRRNEGRSLVDALVEAGRVRMRPILMTALTTIFGLIPMALGVGSGNEMRAPMSRSLIGGMIVGTFLTLIVIPVLYAMFERKGAQKKEVEKQ